MLCHFALSASVLCELALSACAVRLRCPLALSACSVSLFCQLALSACSVSLLCELALSACAVRLRCQLALSACSVSLFCQLALSARSVSSFCQLALSACAVSLRCPLALSACAVSLLCQLVLSACSVSLFCQLALQYLTSTCALSCVQGIDGGLVSLGVPYSYGWAIILLTLSVKLVTFPLTKKQAGLAVYWKHGGAAWRADCLLVLTGYAICTCFMGLARRPDCWVVTVREREAREGDAATSSLGQEEDAASVYGYTGALRANSDVPRDVPRP